MISVKISNKEEFKLAKKNQEVKGKVIRREGMWVSVKLGNPGKRNPHPKDDPNTGYKKFHGCSFSYALTEHNLEIGKFERKDYPVGTIIIYC